MNRIDAIENAISNVLLGIDGTSQGTYTYHSNTGTVNIYDDRLAVAKNRESVDDDDKSVNYIIREQEDTGLEVLEQSIGQGATTERAVYEITARVHNIGDEDSPKNAAKSLMNDVWSDLKFAFGQDYHLSGQVVYIKPLGMVKDYESKGNKIRAGNAITTWEIMYNSANSNPDSSTC